MSRQPKATHSTHSTTTTCTITSTSVPSVCLIIVGFLTKKLPASAPNESESFEKIMADVKNLIIPGVGNYLYICKYILLLKQAYFHFQSLLINY